jgi:hypothetical protein
MSSRFSEVGRDHPEEPSFDVLMLLQFEMNLIRMNGLMRIRSKNNG